MFLLSVFLFSVNIRWIALAIGIKFYDNDIINQLKFEIMLRWSIAFLIVAIVAAIFGFTDIAAGAASIAKILFLIFIVLFVLALIGAALFVKKK